MQQFSTLLAAIAILSTLGMSGQIQFSEKAIELGCGNSTYGTGTLGGGVSFFDFDQDGWDDITLSSEDGQPLRFFKNNNGFFTEVNLGINNTFETKTVQWVDFDNDGDFDFFVTSHWDHNQLYENDGGMQFTDITAAAGLFIEGHLSYGSSWGDYNNDGLLDIFLSSHREISAGFHNMLYKNNGDGTFTDVSEEAGILLDTFTSFCAAFLDYDKDGWQDIYVANDRDPLNHMYHNNGDGTFTEVGIATGTGISIDAMSTTIDDANNDGWLDIYVTNTGEGNVFFQNNGDGTFTDLASTNGTLMESIAWGAVFLDGENNEQKDLYVSAMIDDPLVALTSAYYLSDGAGMYTIPTGIGFDNDHAISFGNAIGDINNDGLPDIAVLNYTPDDMFLFKNESSPTNNWLKVKLEGVVSNRQGIGSWIEISVNGEKQYNYTLCGEGYLGQNSAYEFFGIGTASQIDYIKVSWLSGIEDIIEFPDINSHMTLVEGSTLAIDDSVLGLGIKLYPNPSYGSFTLKIPESTIGSKMMVIDMTGRVLYHSEIISKETTFNFSGYTSGIYLVTLDHEGVTFSEKLILR
jgi:VCBS repeat protein/ASPIC/UnbV protein/type IX secretion system substrate protein